MWTRAELKEKAKVALKRNYWSCVLVAFILGLLITGNSASVSNINGLNNSSETEGFLGNDFHYNIFLDDFSREILGLGFVILSIVAIILVIVFVIALVLQIFVFSPIEVGGCRFFVENSFDNASSSLLFYGFTNGHYKNIIYTMFLRNLYTFLWSLLFVIPGIVKSYEYRMVPYLLADCPDMPKEDAFAISKELMMGNKWAAFVLDWSFIGWHILNTFTCGILGIFWINPYVQATNAELFLTLKKNYFSGQNTFQGAEF